MNRHLANGLWLVVLLLSACTSQAQHFDQLTRPVATLTDSVQIKAMLHDLLIPVTGPIHRADIIDFTSNGFGPDDLILLYPSLESYLVGRNVPRSLQDAMKSWELEADYRLDATTGESVKVEDDAHRRQDARAALTGAVLAAVARYYTGDAIDLLLKRDPGGVRLEMWNFDPAAMRYRVPQRALTQMTVSVPGQTFRFGRPTFVMAFRDTSSCVHAVATDSTVVTRACTP